MRCRMATQLDAIDRHEEVELKRSHVLEGKMAKPTAPAKIGMAIFGVALVVGLVYAATHLLGDLAQVHNTGALTFVLLGIALATALAFEFVNGFHDTANAGATVIYTRTLRPWTAVLWSGCWNLIGVLCSRGGVAVAV